MMLDSFLSTLSWETESRGSDDNDKLHFVWTANLLMALGFMTAYKSFADSPLDCIYTGLIKSSVMQYAENYCWAQDTYFLKWSDKIVPALASDRREHRQCYYQWVPFFLLFSAFCFRLPSLVWKYLADHSGMKVHEIIKVASGPKLMDPKVRSASIASVSMHLQNVLKFHRRRQRKNIRGHHILAPLNLPYSMNYVTFIYIFVKFHRRRQRKNIRGHHILAPLNLPYSMNYVTFIFIFVKFHRRRQRKNIRGHHILAPLNLPYSMNYVTFIYIFVKCLYLANAVAQLFLMNHFLGDRMYGLFGLNSVQHMFNNTAWETSGFFPRITFCDFRLREVGSNVQRYSVQCVLTINIFNEKIFLFLWFWYIVLIALTACSIFFWIVVMVIPKCSYNYVTRHIDLSESSLVIPHQDSDVKRFTRFFLQTDGIFIIRLISLHTGVIYGTELVVSLWRAFYCIDHATPSPMSLAYSRGSTMLTGYNDDDDDDNEMDNYMNMKKSHANGVAPQLSQASHKTISFSDEKANLGNMVLPSHSPVRYRQPQRSSFLQGRSYSAVSGVDPLEAAETMGPNWVKVLVPTKDKGYQPAFVQRSTLGMSPRRSYSSPKRRALRLPSETESTEDTADGRPALIAYRRNVSATPMLSKKFRPDENVPVSRAMSAPSPNDVFKQHGVRKCKAELVVDSESLESSSMENGNKQHVLTISA